MNNRTVQGAMIALGLFGETAMGQCGREWVRLEMTLRPPARHEGAFAGFRTDLPGAMGDPSRGALLFGGRGADGSLLGDTWVWQRTSSGRPEWFSIDRRAGDPPPTANASIVQSSVGGSLVYTLSGGLTADGSSRDVYTNNPGGTSWFRAFRSLTDPRWNHASFAFPIASDTTLGVALGVEPIFCWPLLRSTVVLQNGTTWIPAQDVPYANGAWAVSATQIAADAVAVPFGDSRSLTCLPYSAQPNVALLSRASDGTFSWTTINWSIPPRANYGLASRPLAAPLLYEVVLFGGDSGTFPSPNGLFGDTWIADQGDLRFRQVPGPGPSPRRARNQLVYDPSGDLYVLFGGHDGAALDDTWVLARSPIVAEDPSGQAADAGSEIQLFARIGGPGITGRRWQKDGVDLADGATPNGSIISGSATETLTITNVRPLDAGGYRLVATGTCGNATTGAATLFISCLADFNADGFLDFFDYADFVGCFESGTCPPGTTADFNRDGFVDFFDYADFVAAFEAGC